MNLFIKQNDKSKELEKTLDKMNTTKSFKKFVMY